MFIECVSYVQKPSLSEHIIIQCSEKTAEVNRLITGHSAAGEVDFHFFIAHGWPSGLNNSENSAAAEHTRATLEPHVISTQA